MRSVILYNQLTDSPGPDEADVLAQVNLVRDLLCQLNVKVDELQFSLDLQRVITALKEAKPNFVFNLVESVNNMGSLIHFAPSILTSLSIPFTGAVVESMFITSSKPLAKERMVANRIPTSPWLSNKEHLFISPGKQYIIKPIWEEGSLGLDEDCVFWGNDQEFINRLTSMDPEQFFVEEFVPGREFNLSILAGPKGPVVLPPAEILFLNYPNDKPHVVGYKAKWMENTFEYNNTKRTFSFAPWDSSLLRKLKRIALKCWYAFELNGYARVDVRVDSMGNPWVLEVNANPCISPDSGFYAACYKAGIPFKEAVWRIVNDIPYKDSPLLGTQMFSPS